MEMQVAHALAAVLAAIGHYTIAVFQPLLGSQLGNHFKNMAHYGAVLK